MEILGNFAQGIDPTQVRTVTRTATFESFITKEYGPWVVANCKTGTTILRRLQTCFSSNFGLKGLSDISQRDVENWRTRRITNGTKPSTVNRDVGALKSALIKAVEWNLLVEYPLSNIKPFKVDNNGAVRYLAADEEACLRFALDRREQTIREKRSNANTWRAIRGLPLLPDLSSAVFADYLKPLVMLALNTGMRRGELFGLQWSDVDLGKAILTIKGEGTKNGRTRHIPLNEEAHKILSGWRNQVNGQRFVFLGQEGKRLTSIKTSWNNVRCAAGIKNFRFHDCRHHFASRLVMNKVPLNTVRDLLGHTDIKTTLRYSHLAPDHRASAVATLGLGR